MVTRFLFILTAIAASIVATPVFAQEEAFAMGGEQIAPGTRSDFRLTVPARGDEPETFIPVTVFHGDEPGPVLAAVAGVHGFEYAPIIAADRLAVRIDAAELSGTLIIVRVANINGFEGLSPNVNPVDRKNLNRVFPGSPTGTQTERIADVISREVVARADFLMDMHSGDGGEFLEPFIGVYGGPLATDFDHALEVARGFGFPNLVRYSMNTQEQVDTGRSLNRQGVAAGIPTILIEIGQNGSREEEHVEAIAAGAENAMSILGLWQRPERRVPPALRLFESTTGVSASHSGLFTPTAIGGRYVWEGDLIGTITDYSGAEVERLYAPVHGYTLYGFRGPSVTAGDGVLTIGNPIDEF